MVGAKYCALAGCSFGPVGGLVGGVVGAVAGPAAVDYLIIK